MRSHGVDCDYIDVETFIEQRGLTDLRVVSKEGYETKLFHEKLRISFMCDGIIRYKGHYYILEIKTETSYKWSARQNYDEDSHSDQAITYSICFGIDDIMFLYESRDTTAKKGFVVTVTPEMKFSVLSKIEEADQAVAALVPPPIPEKLPRSACTYCAYVELCTKQGPK